MRLFDLPQAKHFCGLAPPVDPGSRQSLSRFHSSLGSSVTTLTEGTKRFEIHQANVLDSVARWLVYSLAHYRRAFDMLVPVSAPWAQVTLYYSSFYAANAVLGMFGGWIGHSNATILVDVEHGAARAQELKIHRKFKSPNGTRGSHRIFWDVFYDAAASISAWAPAELASAFAPVNGDFAWQIEERNNVNYDMHFAWSSSTRFHNTFKPAKLISLSGPPRQQLETTEQMIGVALYFAREVSLPATALEGCGDTGSRLQSQKRLVTRSVPNLVKQSALLSLLEV